MNSAPRRSLFLATSLMVRTVRVGVALLILATPCPGASAQTTSSPPPPGANLAVVATATTSYVSGHETLAALNDGFTPRHSDDKSHGAYGNWPRTGTQWVQYEWSQPITTAQMDVYWFDDHRGVRLPQTCRLLYWDGAQFVDVPETTGLGLAANQFNQTTFPTITTTRLRLEFDGQGPSSTGLLEWRVYDSGLSPNFAPAVAAGVDRLVVQTGRTYLHGTVRDDGKPQPSPQVRWTQQRGPGQATFEDPTALATTARFSLPGDYTLRLAADDGQATSSATVEVRVTPPPPTHALHSVPTTTYQISSPFWRPRLKAIIQNWIPHCIRKIEDPATPEGGLANFVQAGRKLAGHADVVHTGAVFANTWVYNTLESVCLALQVDPADDRELLAAQAALRVTLEDWIPKILSAQEPDGYLHTMYTIQNQRRWHNKHDHEGYQAGYFIEAALAHFHLTNGQDSRLYQAARRLADCWVRQIGPAPKQPWYEGHQELEMALVRLARTVDQRDGPGQGRTYLDLAKFLLDSRRDGEEYDQSHLPVARQYEAVGHAVRAVYSYAGMADVAVETRDLDYHSAVQSLWNSIVNRKYYVTGGIGSGETSEGFGPDFSLPHRAYCESCAGCGLLFFQTKLNHAYQDARYANLAEDTLYNAILGGLDLEGTNFTYTNPLDSSERRYPWHVCPCCVGNLPRTLLSLPSWTYAVGPQTLLVNLYLGHSLTLTNVAGAPLKISQTTDYPWKSPVTLKLFPTTPRPFALRLRVPNRHASDLYTPTPPTDGLTSIALNGQPIPTTIEQGYLVIDRTWKDGDTVEFQLPLPAQRVHADPRIAATRGRVALRRGPLLYNLESVDQPIDGILAPSAPLTSKWRPDLLEGVCVIEGQFADGQPFVAIPNYARLNRGGRSIVWIKDR